jgi:hypothetical protein
MALSKNDRERLIKEGDWKKSTSTPNSYYNDAGKRITFSESGGRVSKNGYSYTDYTNAKKGGI